MSRVSFRERQRLIEAYRQSQIGVRSAFLAQFVPTYVLLDWARLDETGPAWLRVVMALIRAHRQDSASLAESHYDQYRQADLPLASAPLPEITYVHAPEVQGGRDASGGNVRLGKDVKPRIDWGDSDTAAQKSLVSTGPAYLKHQAARGVDEETAKRNGLVVVSGSASRQVLNGGRTATLTLVSADSKALGWARMTDGDPCAFCALLASRGPVYRSEATAGFQAHDHCACVPVAVYSRTAPWPGDASAYRKLYEDNIAGRYSGKDALRAWRRLHDKRQHDAPSEVSA